MRRSLGPLQGARNGEKSTVGRKGTSLERIRVGQGSASFLRSTRGSAAMVDILEVSKQQHRKNGVDNDGSSRDNLYKRRLTELYETRITVLFSDIFDEIAD
jgi:hypothetical protein